MSSRSLAYLEALIAAPSENPPGDERAAADAAARILAGTGAALEVVAGDPRRPNLIARLDSGRPGPKLIFQAHLDTKPAGHAAWTREPFAASRDGGRLYGLGACDTKGGAAAQLAAVARFAEGGRPFRGALEWQGVADEENGSRAGAELLLSQGRLRAEAAVVAEPTDLELTPAQLGNCWTELTVEGVAAHAGTPWKGRSAVDAALEMVEAIRAELRRLPADPRFPGHPRLNIGRVEGGDHPGTLARRCRMLLDIRVRPGERRDDYLGLVAAAADEVARGAGVQAAVAPYAGGGCEANAIPFDHPLVLDLGRAWTSALGTSPKVGPFCGGTDCRYFARAGTPAVVFGPGRLEQAHAADEYVETDDVVRAEEVLLAFAERTLR